MNYSGVRGTREFARKFSAACRVCTWQAIFARDREPSSSRLFIECVHGGHVGGLKQ